MSIPIHSKADLKAKRQALAKNNRAYPKHLVEVPESEWSDEAKARNHRPVRTWQSKDFAVHLWLDPRGARRLTVCRTAINADGSWKDGITWDELQRLKSEAGFADTWAVECYPPDAEVICDANMRHLWLLDEAPPFAWRKGRQFITLRQLLNDYADATDQSILVADGFDFAIIGHASFFDHGTATHSRRAIYDRAACIRILIDRDGMDQDEAEEFFSFNVEGSLVSGGPIYIERLTP